MKHLLLILFTLSILGCKVPLKQTLKEKEKTIYKADLDKEFDLGSTIKFPKLTSEIVTNLELLGKIWGFLKYHHPEVGKGNYNWDYELFRALPLYLAVDNNQQRDLFLLKWVSNYGKIKICDTCSEMSSSPFLLPDLAWVTEDNLNKNLQKKLLHIYKNRHQGDHYYIDMVFNVGNPIFTNEKPYAKMPYPDVGFRLLALYKYWNMIHYFFPYKHLMDKDWNPALKNYIPSFVEAKDELAYEFAAIQLIGDIQDTHANLWEGGDKIDDWKGSFYPPFHVQFIEDQLVVTDYYNPELKEQTGLEIGDIITKINQQDVGQIVDEISKYYPASNGPTRLRNITPDLLRSNDTEIEITHLHDSNEMSSLLQLYDRSNLNIYRWYRRDNNKCYQLLDNNIGYITLKSIKKEDIPKIKEAFKNTKGIIIDIRNYPSAFVPFTLGSYFVNASTPFVKFTTCSLDNPGAFTFTKNLEIPKSEEYYQGKLVILVNEITQSQAEYTTMAFQAGSNTTVIGSTTAGADGNVSKILLPGGLRTMMSGIGVYYPNGDETQRIGIIPDIEVKPTIEGIKNGKDELLEKAIEIILNK